MLMHCIGVVIRIGLESNLAAGILLTWLFIIVVIIILVIGVLLPVQYPYDYLFILNIIYNRNAEI